MKIHEKIRAIRQSKDYTQDYIADKLSIDTVNYGRIERGQAKLTVDRLLKICDILEINPSDLFNDFAQNNEPSNKICQKIYEELLKTNKILIKWEQKIH